MTVRIFPSILPSISVYPCTFVSRYDQKNNRDISHIAIYKKYRDISRQPCPQAQFCWTLSQLYNFHAVLWSVSNPGSAPVSLSLFVQSKKMKMDERGSRVTVLVTWLLVISLSLVLLRSCHALTPPNCTVITGERVVQLNHY